MANKVDREIQSWTSSRKRTPADEVETFRFMLSEQGLSLSDGDPPARYIQNLIGAVFVQRGVSLKNGLPTDDRILPKDFAVSMGRSSITLNEYLTVLCETGCNVDKLHSDAEDFDNSYTASRRENETRAIALFDLLINAPFPGVSDEQIHQYLDSGSIYNFVAIVLENASASRGRVNAQAKLANDPKQREKVNVRECWELWQKEPQRYKGKAAFARDMLSKYESLESQRVIERWCKEWESEPS